MRRDSEYCAQKCKNTGGTVRAAWTTSVLFALLIGQSPAFAGGLSWLESYPYGQPVPSKLIAAGLAPGTLENTAVSQQSRPSSDSAVTESQPLGSRSAITENHSIGTQNGHAQMPAWWNEPLQAQEQQPNPGLVPYHTVSAPWYDTSLGVLGIGVAATGTTMLFDHGVNHYADTHIGLFYLASSVRHFCGRCAFRRNGLQARIASTGWTDRPA